MAVGFRRVVLSLCLGVIYQTSGLPSKATCGYDSCSQVKPDMLNVHLIAHSHMDLGWLKTVDQYFFGTKAYVQNQAVQYIYDSVLKEVEKDSSRRFIFVETGFFELWWKHRKPDEQTRFYNLVQSGQLEFISGGYVMNDEATVHYSNTIDQMSYGIRILRELFGKCGVPKIGWQIDPFGHSREYASILAQMGMDGYFFGRLDYQDKTNRQATKTMEFIWRASENLQNASDIFTGVLPNTYSPPPNFCFDAFCNDEVLVDAAESDEYNIPQRIADFFYYSIRQSKFYSTNNIPVTMGNDFNYQDAAKWFNNLDSIIKYTNKLQANGSKINVLYSTPSCYLKAVRESKTSNWSVKTDDFFPYSSDPHAFWTGYFTSRPAFKYLDRVANNWFQAAKQLSVIANNFDESKLTPMRVALGIGQHHDAVSGTAKQAVSNDYTKRISQGLAIVQEAINEDYKKIFGDQLQTQIFCNQLNMSACKVSEEFATKMAVIVYNPLAHNTSAILRIPISGNFKVNVSDISGTGIRNQILSIPPSVRNLAERKSNATHEIVFTLPLKPFEAKQLFVEKSSSKTAISANEIKKHPLHQMSTDSETIKGLDVEVTVDSKTGLLKAVTANGLSFNVKQSFYMYESACGNNLIFANRSSGAYIFRPKTNTPIALDKSVTYSVEKGEVSEEIRQQFTPWLSQVIRVYKTLSAVEFDWIVGPIPVADKIGKEIITRFDTDIASGTDFFTDANGRELLLRVRDYRPTWNLSLQEAVAGNYYPVNSRIIIFDDTKQLSILTDRSQGGSSLDSGNVELMIHRRCLCDDAFGVDEPLNEPGVDGKGLVVRGRHWALFEKVGSSQHRSLAQSLYMAPIVSFADISKATPFRSSLLKSSIIQDDISLPENVHILTLDMWEHNKILLRLEHFFEYKDQDKNNSSPATVSLSKIFKSKVLSVEEMTLAVTESAKLNAVDGTDVKLTSMQIRTFLVTIE